VSFSEKFLGELEQKFIDGYQVKSASVNALMYWWDKKQGCEFLILFPELVLEKETNTLN
jgi:hypothetical protein